jgi:hypothetical protein
MAQHQSQLERTIIGNEKWNYGFSVFVSSLTCVIFVSYGMNESQQNYGADYLACRVISRSTCRNYSTI